MNIGDHQPEIDALLREHFPEPKANGSGSHKHEAPILSDDKVVELCRKARNAAKFASLFDDGDTTAYVHDASRADQALISFIAFYTQDPAQLDRLFRQSALMRSKWERYDYRQRTIKRALDNLTETYRPGDGTRIHPNGRGSSPNSNSNSHPIGENENYDSLTIVSVDLGEVEEPAAMAFLVEALAPKGWPVLIHGAGGIAKTLIAQSLAQALVNPDVSHWCGYEVGTCNVLIVDLELNQRVQARRAYQLARGEGNARPPRGLRYMSTFGVPRSERRNVLKDALEECRRHKCEAVIIDSVGLALQGGDATDHRDIIGFFEEAVAAFVGVGITPFLIDHQRRAVVGEKTQQLGAFGSVYKENLTRSQIQLERVGSDNDAGTLTVRMRHKKTNFGRLAEPVGIKLTFSEERITLELAELTDADRAEEETLSSEDRIIAALRNTDEEAAWPAELAEATGLSKGTVQNILSALRRGGRVEYTGEVNNRAKRVRITKSNSHFPIKGENYDYDSKDLSEGDKPPAPPVLTVEAVLEEFGHNPASQKMLNRYLKTFDEETFEFLAKTVVYPLGKLPDPKQEPDAWRSYAPAVEAAVEEWKRRNP